MRCDCDDEDVIVVGANADAIERVDRRHNAVVAAAIVVIMPFAGRRLDDDDELHPGACGFPSVR